jgi:hypothetical protein
MLLLKVEMLRVLLLVMLNQLVVTQLAQESQMPNQSVVMLKVQE